MPPKMTAKKQKPSQLVKATIPMDVYKRFKSLSDAKGFTMSQWIRHQIIKFVK
jgi:NRPS condensation-like uncharacterized protein